MYSAAAGEVHRSFALLRMTNHPEIKTRGIRLQLFSELGIHLLRQSEVLPLQIERTNLITTPSTVLPVTSLFSQAPRKESGEHSTERKFSAITARQPDVPNLICFGIVEPFTM